MRRSYEEPIRLKVTFRVIVGLAVTELLPVKREGYIVGKLR